ELEKKYGFVMGGCVIRVPAGKNEILEEGRKLKHCVGGYADRHMRGAVTILFMRKVKKPNEPYVTIEMRGNKIMQIHGYRNDIGGENPRTQHKEFLAAWLNWLKRGSPQDKQGNPKLPRKEKGAAA
ncbi:MAG: PcfJ domain-containing protein, partial [Oscillospiraceae bacterium]|nr:PcfJ domain-containing protein [Oscillospiraceae bacterium]